MIISCLYPQKIYIDDENTKEQIENIFGKYPNVQIGEWFECPKFEIKLFDDDENKNHNVCNNNFQNSKITYIVKPMDNFEKVSKKLNISIEELKQIAKTKNLFVGQRIDIQKG